MLPLLQLPGLHGTILHLLPPTPTPPPRRPNRRQNETEVGVAAGEDISLGRRVTSRYRGGQGREEAEPLQGTDQCTSPLVSSSLALCRGPNPGWES